MERTDFIAECALREVALQHNITVEEVKKEIESAMLAAQFNPDSKIREKPNLLFASGKIPTPEELVSFVVNQIVKNDTDFQ